MTARTVVSVGGVVAVTAYAAFLAAHALVFDPLAAVPGKSLAEVYAGVDAIGMDSRQDVVGVIATAVTGTALAIAVAVIGIRRWVPTPVVAVFHLTVLASGAVATFESGFLLGMDVGDAFGVSGGAHGPSAGALYAMSLTALVAIPVVLVLTWFRGVRRARAVA